MKTFTEYCAGKVIGFTQAESSKEAAKKLAKRYLYPESIVLCNKEASAELHFAAKVKSEEIAHNAYHKIALVTS